MGKKITLTLVLFTVAFVIVGCFSVGNCPQRNPANPNEVISYEQSANAGACRWTTLAQPAPDTAQNGNDGSPPQAVPYDPTPAPAQPTDAPAQPTPTIISSDHVISSNGCLTPQGLVSITPKNTTATYPAPLINALDARSEKVHHATGGWQIDPPAVIWTGLYYAGSDVTLGGKLVKYSVDGQTGVYLVKKSVTIQSPGASACLTSLGELANGLTTNDNLDASTKTVSATGCVDKSVVVGVINAFKGSGETLFNRLDELVDMNGQVQLSGETTVPAGTPATRIIWVRTGALEGTEGKDWVKLHEAGSKTAYLLATDAEGTVTWLYRGLVTCTGIDPKNDFPSWWGK